MAAVSSGRSRRARQPLRLLGRLEQGSRQGLPHPDAGPAGHRPVLPIDRNTLPLRGDAAAQARYLEHFRADSIIADAELIRQAVGSEPWTVYGQSYGGFCALTYLSFAPRGLREVLITGGLAPLTGSPERVYRETFRRVAARNAEYFGWYPRTGKR